ncbi:glutaredoxin family protein [Undibacterium curvum]|uniref:glutaredoxin family protein n=1 Tax=Undibacterium curvum TaxID=2762294 RepID=UPI003D0FA1E9
MIAFTLYSRSYCHLCDDMLTQLNSYSQQYPFTVDVLDVDADEELLSLYDELVPVLIGRHPGGDAQRICHYHLDEAALRQFFAKV